MPSTETIRQQQIRSQNYKLSFIFRDNPSLGWELLEQECKIYTDPNIEVEDVNKLSSLYSSIVLKLNELQDSRQTFFHNKMQKLMSEPFVIRCYSNQNQNKQSLHEDKRKQLEMKLALETEKSHSQAFKHIMDSQNVKEKKLQNKIQEVISSHDKNLESRLKKRMSKIEAQQTPKKKSSDSTKNPSENGFNPEGKCKAEEQIGFLDFSNIKREKPKDPNYAARTQSERINVLKFNVDSSDESEDEFNISKLIHEENKQRMMAKKRRIGFQNLER